MNTKILISLLSAMLALPLNVPAATAHYRDAALPTVAQGRHHDRKYRHRGDKHRYVVIGNDVFYRGSKLDDASAHSFTDLGRGYAKDAFNVYYKGKKLDDASANSFTVLSDGYAKDSFNAYYKGRKIDDASANSFTVLSDGYAKDSFNTYYKGHAANRW